QDDKKNALSSRFGSRISYIHCDVLSEQDIAAAVEVAQSSFGGLDILFNNAGIRGTPATVSEMEATDWDHINAILVRGPMLGMKHAIPLLRAGGGGSIINTGSI